MLVDSIRFTRMATLKIECDAKRIKKKKKPYIENIVADLHFFWWLLVVCRWDFIFCMWFLNETTLYKHLECWDMSFSNFCCLSLVEVHILVDTKPAVVNCLWNYTHSFVFVFVLFWFMHFNISRGLCSLFSQRQRCM